MRGAVLGDRGSWSAGNLWHRSVAHAHGDTKTERSKRTLALPEFVAEGLREHRARQAAERLRAGSRWKEHDLVFASTIGTPRSAGNVRRDFRAICEKAGLGKDWSPRELRHSFVSNEAGPGKGECVMGSS